MRLTRLAFAAASFAAAAPAASQTLVAGSRAPAGACVVPESAPAAFVELTAPVARTDTLATLRVCLVTGEAADPAASFHGELRWDSLGATAATISRSRVGMVIENATQRGRIIFAGASPSGFHEAVALTVTLRLARAGLLPAVSLAMRELNTVNARALAPVATVTGWPRGAVKKITPAAAPATVRAASATVPTTPPVIARLTPSFAAAQSDEPATMDIEGQSFAAEGNVVKFGPVELRNVTSANNGTLIRIFVPREASVSAEAPPMQLTAGTYRVSVRTARGESNSVDFVIR